MGLVVLGYAKTPVQLEVVLIYGIPIPRLILIAERSTVYEKFPTPLINRLEKHFVLTSSVLHEWQLDVLDEFKEWIHQFSHAGQSGFVKCLDFSVNIRAK